jgi:hypothetical protein
MRKGQSMVFRVLRVMFIVLGLPMFLLARFLEFSARGLDRLLDKLDDCLATLEDKTL